MVEGSRTSFNNVKWFISRLWWMLSLPHFVTSHKYYQSRIPNGGTVPHPCKPNYIWPGVGHFIDQGRGITNPFGADFDKAGRVWTAALCRKDSDGDGMTNGQELGDPNCLWQKGAIPDRTTSLSHPGVCEPWDSPKCFSKEVASPKYRTQEEWMRDMCKAKEFVCAGLNESDVRNMSLRLLNGKVPAKETTYMCQIFDFEAMVPPGDYHLIAVEPILDNRYVIHHIVLFGCHDFAVPSETPYECGMVASRFCYDFLNIWTIGLAGECYHPQTGIRIGTKGYARMALQLHWNNPQNKSGWTDTSGLKLFYTANRRQYDAATFITGLDEFVLPPGRRSIKLSSTCTSTCSRQSVTRPAWVTKAWNHMHYVGRKMSIELVRNGKSVTFLTNDATYSYDSPHVAMYEDNPVQLLPGDELITTCEYSTLLRRNATSWGQATNDEMCIGLLSFYPKRSIIELFCIGHGPSISYCDNTTFRGCSDLLDFFQPEWVNASSLYNDLNQKCSLVSPCQKECKQAILQHRKKNPCLQDNTTFTYIKSWILISHDPGVRLMNLMKTCEVEVNHAMSIASVETATTRVGEAISSASLTASCTSLILLATALTIGCHFVDSPSYIPYNGMLPLNKRFKRLKN